MTSDRRTSTSDCSSRCLRMVVTNVHVGGLTEIYRRKCGAFLSALEKYVRPVDPEIRVDSTCRGGCSSG